MKKDKSQAIFWYRQAAKYKHVEALFNLALSYDIGNGVEASPKEAFSFYRRAAALGHDGAQCNLGVSYLEGLRTKRMVLPKSWTGGLEGD